jgi:hypothetical protein
MHKLHQLLLQSQPYLILNLCISSGGTFATMFFQLTEDMKITLGEV